MLNLILINYFDQSVKIKFK